jgi:hypothetical protein
MMVIRIFGRNCMKKFVLLAVMLVAFASSACAATAIDSEARVPPLERVRSNPLLLAQAQAPGRPTTTQEQQTTAPAKPNKDPIVSRPPPPPGTPNFPQRPANQPPLKN